MLQFPYLLNRNKTNYLTEVSAQVYRKKCKAVWRSVLEQMNCVLLRGREIITERQIATYLQNWPAKEREEGGECSRERELEVRKGEAHLGSSE